MKAIVCVAPGRLDRVERPEPQPAPGEALIEIRRIGICGTDFHIYGGTHPFLVYPRVMGHELSGTVATAPRGSGLEAGQTVYIVPYLACGSCNACRRGRTNCCRQLSVLGVHQDGGMAERIAVPVANVVPAMGIPLDDAAMIEFLAIGAHGIRRAAVETGERVLVVGAGPIGLAAAIFAQARGAVVTVMDRRADRLAFAEHHVGVAAIVPADDGAGRRLHELSDGELFEVVVDATGNAAAMQQGFAHVAHGGRYVLLGIVRERISFDDPEFHKRETTLLASRNAQPQDFAEVVRQMAAGKVPTAALATHRGPLDAAPRLLPDWHRPEAGVVKAILEL